MIHPLKPEILLVEDDRGDVLLIREAFQQCGDNVQLHVVEDGEEALFYLRRKPPFASASRPDLILLDLNLPRKDGREVLAEIKQDPELKEIPVLILTTSDSAQDVKGAYRMHANCYLTKPMGLDRFVEMARQIREFWMRLVMLPPR